jgi:putative heme iron utilization protein
MADSAPSPTLNHDVPPGEPGIVSAVDAIEEGRRLTPAEEARTLVSAANTGTLATLSDDGGPWASLVAYGVLDDGSPVLFVSRLAEHARNLDREPRASLVVTAAVPAEDALAGGRVTLAGTAYRPDGELADVARDRYIAAVPTAKAYAGFRDFALWTLRVERVRWVGGYGRMGSATGEDYAAAAADPIGPIAAGAVAHLNDDHADALLAMARALAGHPDATAAQCHAVDRYGLDLFITTPRGFGLGRLPFAQPVHDAVGLRAATVELARRARA